MESQPRLPQTRQSPTIYEGHTRGINSVAFSPDGKSVASSSNDNTIRLWSIQSPSTIGDSLIGHAHWVDSISYSPLGNILASVSPDKTIRLWDVSQGRQLSEPLRGDHWFHSVAFSPDPNLIASGSGKGLYGDDGTACSVQLWDIRKRALATKPLKGHTGGVRSLAFTPDGTRVISGSFDKTIRVWDIERETTIDAPLEGHTGWVRSISLSPDGSRLVSCSADRTLRLWDIRSGKTISKPYEGHADKVDSTAFSPNDTYVVSGGQDHTVRLWDIRTGKEVDQPFEEHTDWVTSVAFSPCGQYVASGSHDQKLIIRSIFSNSPKPSNDVERCKTPENENDIRRARDETTQTIVGQMTTQQMFDCLVVAGCIDLSSQMDTSQGDARIVSGGGFGDIWIGKLHSGTKVAIKAWRTDALEQCRYKTLKLYQRAARELFYWSRMQHRNIHELMGVVLFRGQYLGMVSEWMENGNLQKYLRNHPGADRYQLCVDVASGLSYMHSRSTVHGDLKGANVLVSSDGVARLSDFDFSVMSEASSLLFSESSNTRSGSIRWVAPEMLIEESPKRTTQADVYALGMVYNSSKQPRDILPFKLLMPHTQEIFTGEVPYPNCRMDYAVLAAVMRGTLPPRPIEQLENNERGNLTWQLLLRCWNRNLAERPKAKQVLEIIWNVQRRIVASDPFDGHTAGIGSVEFSSDNTQVISCSWDHTIRLWDVERGLTVVGPLEGHTSAVRKAVIAPNGSQIASCSHDCTLRFWDSRSGKPIGKPYEGHTDMVFSISFSPCSTYIVSGARDATVRLWDIRKGQQVDQPFEDHSHDVNSVAFSPCGQYVASGSRDCKVIIRGIMGKDPGLVTHPKSESHAELETTHIITSQMSAQQMFDCLIASGCVDLSSQMDSRQNTAMIVSGGGFGDIWMGKLYNGLRVAIKAWRTNSFEQCSYKTLKRAARELFYWSRMEHENIHQLMGVIMFKNEYLGMVSEWMEHGNLHEYLRKHMTADRYQLCIDVASGLKYMHSRRTIHGDLKAANVLVSPSGVARLSDFDFAIMSEAGSLWFSESSNG
ncbi:unnamed protein product [Rhizoctonia solani]|uniref:Protein kinase domain-containing protein n=1 Tax=Rhizoctonia solani TaxID=456999 RepID=A0A8H3HZ08_9AGAM|nr:unnamed protein product [Rhizoctonia solani]